MNTVRIIANASTLSLDLALVALIIAFVGIFGYLTAGGRAHRTVKAGSLRWARRTRVVMLGCFALCVAGGGATGFFVHQQDAADQGREDQQVKQVARAWGISTSDARVIWDTMNSSTPAVNSVVSLPRGKAVYAHLVRQGNQVSLVAQNGSVIDASVQAAS